MNPKTKLHSARSLDSRELTFLWRRRFPLGMVSVIAGEPGSGKSTLATLIACEISKLGLVSILSNPEDDLQSTVKPRLDAMGGNHDLIYALDTDMELPRDQDRLEDLILQAQASVLVLDPIASHFPRLHDRRALRSLALLAARTRCSILGLHHMIKNGDGLAGVGGSMGGLVGTARAVYAFERDNTKHGPDDVPTDRWRLRCLKMNGAPRPPYLLIERTTVEIGENIEAPSVRVVGHGFYENPNVVASAAEWLTNFLAAGADCIRLNGEVRTQGQKAGYSWGMLQTLGADLGFYYEALKKWQLPASHPLRTKEEYYAMLTDENHA